MTLQHWLSEQRLRAHKTSKEEIRNLLSKVERDLEDAAIVDLSTDRRFMIAYDGALTLATIPLYCEGYETRGKGQHWLTSKLLPEIMGNEFSDLANYLDQCRTKRNISAYDRTGQISLAELDELLREVQQFRDRLLLWLHESHPGLI